MKQFFTTEELANLDKHFKINLINSAAGVKPAVLIGTRSILGVDNLAIFSSLLHLGSNPPLMGFILRPHSEVPRHTYQNILDTKYYTINHVPANLWQSAHRTGDKFPDNISEFDACGFTPAFQQDFHAPYVAESSLTLGLAHVQSIPIALNNTTLVIGQVLWLAAEKVLLGDDGLLNHATHAGVSGLNGYYNLHFAGKADR